MRVNRQIEVSGNGCALDKRKVTLGDRIESRRKAVGISQAELARRVGVRQSTINSLINGDSRSSRSIVRIALILGTTPAFLTGETDDPDEGAPPPAPTPRVQMLMMPVVLPSEAALAEMYEAQLRALARLEGAALARALAKRLPRALARLRETELYEETDDVPEESEAAQPQPIDHPARQQARRT